MVYRLHDAPSGPDGFFPVRQRAPRDRACRRSAPYYQVIIPARGALADTIFVRQSAIFGPSRTADSAVRTMREAAAQDAVLLIRGESPQKTFRILYDALRLSRSGSMPREIIWVAPVGFTDKARRLHRRFGVKIRLAPPPS
ncbi:MAG TPA: hypothetical protein ENG36_01295 [Lentisphaerae bacterium]|nr:hypothetical protein [Lentisphaerota bacterium]